MIRAAENSDSGFVAKMYYTAGPNLFAYFFESPKYRIINLLKSLYRSENTIFSKDYFYVYDDDGILKGAAIFVPGNKVSRLEYNTLLYSWTIIKYIGLRKYLNALIKDFSVNSIYPDVCRDELFIQAISIDEKYRGQHVGSQMLKFAEVKAFEMGFKKVSLFVEVDNERAVSVYKKNGFKIVQTRKFESNKLLEYNLKGFYKMTLGV